MGGAAGGHSVHVVGLHSEFAVPSLSNGGDYGGNMAMGVLPLWAAGSAHLLLLR